VIDIGAESTHPDAEDVPAELEIARLEPVVRAVLERGLSVSIDTCKPTVMRAMAAMGVHWLNDVGGFRHDDAMAAAADAPPRVKFVVMHSRRKTARADRTPTVATGLLGDIRAFFAERLATFARHRIDASRLVFDPGMGFFLSADASASLQVLRHLSSLSVSGVPLLVSVSRKSFVGEVCGQPIGARGAGSLAAELWAARAGAAFIRTHDPAAFRSAWAVEQAIRGAPPEQ
jgi:dihydropteroate synthase